MSQDTFAEQHAALLPPAAPEPAGYLNYCRAAFGQAFVMMVRRMRVVMAAVVCMLPVLIPLATAFLSRDRFAQEGADQFRMLVEHAHITVLAPLLALFFGSMLIGEDIEANSIPYVLTRPMPRSAWVLGRFAAYLAVTGVILLVSIALTFAASTSLARFGVSAENLGILAQYSGVALLALLGNGAVAVFLGTTTKRPIVTGVVILYGWQQLAVKVPGVIDFFTIEKYTSAMLPVLASQRGTQDSPEARQALIEFTREVYAIGAAKACIVLLCISAAFLALTIAAVRIRQFASSRAIGA